MKSNPSKYISFVLLALFICVFSFQHVSAANYTKTKDNTASPLLKSTVSIHKPCDESSADDQSFFENENETEDESKTELDAGLPVFGLQLSHSILLSENAVYSPSLTEGTTNTQHPLYLVICTFRI